ncbi:T9SS type A sorting domain-containing protein [Chitinophagaceae bacterium LB-8]|uniref:T9SS type A sorting domain-containing protein n=1 Tax=Paraflavisolibacter caeni TaxID=2982496 RepID=A0A9X2XYG1_9BACT|nr:choice-of-anchor Q domain-containing protein [Paraflavisolibacter caeni]MCU7549933.1 T9SS type A sorting domain-containing protein [Paraflavisolibacter caeni]
MKSIIIALCLLFCLHTFSQAIYYVNDNATGANNGSSWTNAFTKLQDALAVAVSGDQIWVAAGIYYPDEGGGLTNNDRTHSFHLKNGVALYGGFVGTETLLNTRNWQTNVTTLSGDISQDVNGNNANNSFHVVQSASVGNTAVLDGFTITGGNANGLTLPDNLGGGMYNNESSPTLTNCSFSKNSADKGGGGMYNNESSPTLTNCSFLENSAFLTGGGMHNELSSSPRLINCSFSGNMVDTDGAGAGMYNSSSSPTLTNCNFSGNRAIDAIGAGMFNSSSSPILINCIFSENESLHWGGGMYNYNSSPILTNCSFVGNNAAYDGGGMYNSSSSPVLTNCSFWGNSVEFDGGGMYNSGSSPTLTNCILWENINGQIFGNAVVTYSIVQGGFTGTGNLDQDPLFVDATNGDLHLQAGSPAIDAGLTSANTTTVDLEGKPRVVNGIIDMGAYEFQVTAAPVVITSVTANPSTLWPPNHKMKEVEVTTVTTGGSGSTSCQITTVSSNESQNGGSKDDLSPDWQIMGNDKVLLRAERDGKGSGRIYTITVTCTDAIGSSDSKTVQVKVPHDQGKFEITQSERSESIGDISGALHITASPNPSSNAFNLTISGGVNENITLRVMNALGKVIEQRQNIKSGQTLQIGQGYAAGMYIIEILQGSERSTIKVVKQ